jgi:hypothetical protein
LKQISATTKEDTDLFFGVAKSFPYCRALQSFDWSKQRAKNYFVVNFIAMAETDS